MSTPTSSDAEKVAAFDTLAALNPDLFRDNATYFSCTEADAIAVFVTAAHGQEMATSFLQVHAWGDDDGDGHNPDGTSRKSVIDKEIR